jgi:hypothetical protein
MIQEILIPDSLYEQAANLAQEMQIPPSDLFSLALEEYLHRHYNQKSWFKASMMPMPMDWMTANRQCWKEYGDTKDD